MKVEILFAPGCPHAAEAVALVERCLARLGIDADLAAREADVPSPSVLVNGVDVMGPPDGEAAVCRLDRPTEERVLGALAEALS
jgi:hypothetical protein